MNTMNKREKILLIAVGILFAGLILYFGSGLISGSGAKRAARDKLAEDVKELKQRSDRNFAVIKRMNDLKEQALPESTSDPYLASRLYQNWLLALADRHDFKDKKVDPNGSRLIDDYYHKLSYSVTGETSLENLSLFLRDIDSAKMLHQIRGVTIKPLDQSRRISVTISIEAVSLPDAVTKNDLPSLQNPVVADIAPEEYIDPITDRGLFSFYVPPRPPDPPRPPEEDREPPPPPPQPPMFDHSLYTYVGGIISVDGRPQVWIDIRTQGKKYKLYPGESFPLGSLDCKVARIERDRVVIDVAGGLYGIALGHSFAEAEVVE